MDEYINRSDFMNRITPAHVQSDFSKMTGPQAYAKIIGMLNNHTAADVAPVRRGKWNPDGSCSLCGEYDNKDQFGSKFCPNCGANMDGGDNDGTST